MNDSYGLSGKRAVITGASKGLGRVSAEVFAEHGVKVLLAARSQEQLEQVAGSLSAPHNHTVYAGDLTRQQEIAGLADAAEKFGEIDVVLHVMGGGLGMRDRFLSWNELDRLFKTNVAAAVEINRLLIPGMVDRGTGNIVHVGSVAGTEAVGSVGYNTVKAALSAYTRSLGRELADTGVIATGILPGGFQAPENSFERLRSRDPELLDRVIAERQPRGRLGDAKVEIVPLLLFLASRQATMMTGCCVPVDGGEGLSYV
jgi:NAD(P)-dependent dehydrogenase (short-subunit alcohol dehydrogenase family)